MSGQSTGADAKSRLTELWARLAQETPEAGAAQVRAWLAIDGMCRQHADVLETMATRLADTWTPTKGSAAEAFQAFVGRLVGSMRLTAQAAYRNGLNVDAFHQDLMETRTGVARLMAEFERRENSERTSGSGGLAGSAAAMSTGGWRRRLADDAVALMAATDANADLVTRIAQVPQRYVVGHDRFAGTPGDPLSGGGGSGSGGSNTTQVGRDGAASSWADAPHGSSTSDQGVPVLTGGAVPGPSSGSAGGGGWHASGGSDSPDRPTVPGGSSVGNPGGRMVGRLPAAPGNPGGEAGSSGRAGGMRSGASPNAGVGSHGGGPAGLMGAPMMPMTGGMPITTRDGTRIGRPGGVIGGQRGERPYDPDDPWAVSAKGVAPIIGVEQMDTTEESDEVLPPGVVKVRGWPR
ncbi:hypothetical protein [Luedemannella helvata]|uniref:PPE family domain-containing protein n=1 Tax=Luedemannella helvata TaxID=349315 RepID=A0ABN2KE18_9ACTN